MGTGYTPTAVQSGFQSNDLFNSELSAIRTDLEEKVDRTGRTPNDMEADFDMGDNQILNVDDGVLLSDGVNLGQVQNLINTAVGGATTDPSDPTFNFQVALGSQGLNNRTEFDLNTLFGVTSFNAINVYVNGVIQIPGLAYSVSGTLVTFTESLDTDSNILFIFADLSLVPALPNIFLEIAAGYDVGMYYKGTTDASDEVLAHVLVREAYLPDGATGSRVYANVAATANTTFDIQKNSVSIGSFVVNAAAQTATFTVTGNQQFAVGDRLEVIAPGTPDATLADIMITMKLVLGTP